MTTKTWALTSARLVPAAFMLAACSGGGGGDGSLATAPGASVLVSSASEAIVESLAGGFGPQRPVGAACDSGLWTYDLGLDAGRLAWIRCDIAGTGTNPTDYTPSTGSRILSASEQASAKAALGAVHVSAARLCGADKNTMTLEIVGARASLVYGDDFYGCDMKHAQYVESNGLTNFGIVLNALAHN